MIGDIGVPELLIILAIVVLLFGVGRIGRLGKDLGTSVREFRRAVTDDQGQEHADQARAQIQEFHQSMTGEVQAQPVNQAPVYAPVPLPPPDHTAAAAPRETPNQGPPAIF